MGNTILVCTATREEIRAASDRAFAWLNKVNENRVSRPELAEMLGSKATPQSACAMWSEECAEQCSGTRQAWGNLWPTECLPCGERL